jgi:hypothetical protein
MTIIEIKNMIKLLREKKDYAFKNLKQYRSGRSAIDPKNYHEFKTLVGNLIFEIAKQKPMYSISYNEAIQSEMSHENNLNKLEGIINAIEEEIKIGTINDYDDKKDKDVENIIDNIFNNFHSCSRQARNRYKNRPTIDVQDEYDVQDLLHIFLKLHFSDIRPEEYTPNYAGQSARMDFLIKEYNVVIETKKTRDTLRDKEIGSQLIEDIERYKNHPNCHKLYCFVYDPEGLIGNPKGLENDLSGTKDHISVKVVIKP